MRVNTLAFNGDVAALSRLREYRFRSFGLLWKGGIAADLDPMSNVSYRVYQLRVMPSNTWFRVATGALVVLLALAAIAAVFALRQRPEGDVADQETVVT